MKIRLVLTGRNYDAARRLPDALDLPEGSSVRAAIERVQAILGPGAPLAPACLVAVSGTHLGTVGACREQALREGDELVLIAPVAGG